MPVVMVFEDAHWIDRPRASVDLPFVYSVRSLPVLLIVTSRPEFQMPDGPAAGQRVALNRSIGATRPRWSTRSRAGIAG
jgi:hypothetical protein